MGLWHLGNRMPFLLKIIYLIIWIFEKGLYIYISKGNEAGAKKEQMMTQLENLLNLATELIVSGKSTVETAFVDAIQLEQKHLEGMVSMLYKSSYVSPKVYDEYAKQSYPAGFTADDKMYSDVVDIICRSVHAKINSK